jgi:hypothetical protein
MSEELRTPWTSFAGLVGEDLGEPVFTDPPQEPGKTATAIGKHVHQQRAEAEHERNMAQLGQAAADAADQEALDRAVSRIRRGRKVKPAMAAAAMRALRAEGSLDLSSAELLALQSSAYQEV